MKRRGHTRARGRRKPVGEEYNLMIQDVVRLFLRTVAQSSLRGVA